MTAMMMRMTTKALRDSINVLDGYRKSSFHPESLHEIFGLYPPCRQS